MREADVEALREVGLSDAAIHDVAQVTALFNYYNRIADGLGISIDPTT
jgi:alkylhydroperoxidase family enzyme